MSTGVEPHGLGRDEGRAIWFLGTLMVVKATKETTNGDFSLVEQVAPPGFATPIHVHHGEDEPFYVLEGEVTFRCGEQVIKAGPGSYVYAPRDVPHWYSVTSAGPARLLILTTPAGLEDFFIELSEPADGPRLPPGPPDFQEIMPRMLDAAARFRIEILGPPPLD